MSDLESPFIECPHCDSTLKPESQGHGVYLCPCCGKTFTPTIERLVVDDERPRKKKQGRV